MHIYAPRIERIERIERIDIQIYIYILCHQQGPPIAENESTTHRTHTTHRIHVWEQCFCELFRVLNAVQNHSLVRKQSNTLFAICGSDFVVTKHRDITIQVVLISMIIS